jgi:hypothetical protein
MLEHFMDVFMTADLACDASPSNSDDDDGAQEVFLTLSVPTSTRASELVNELQLAKVLVFGVDMLLQLPQLSSMSQCSNYIQYPQTVFSLQKFTSTKQHETQVAHITMKSISPHLALHRLSLDYNWDPYTKSSTEQTGSATNTTQGIPADNLPAARMLPVTYSGPVPRLPNIASNYDLATQKVINPSKTIIPGLTCKDCYYAMGVAVTISVELCFQAWYVYDTQSADAMAGSGTIADVDCSNLHVQGYTQASYSYGLSATANLAGTAGFNIDVSKLLRSFYLNQA